MNTNISLEVKRVLIPVIKQYEYLVYLTNSEKFHVVSKDYPDFYFKILKRELSSNNKAFYHVELSPESDRRFKGYVAIYVDDLLNGFQRWLKRIIEHKEFDTMIPNSETIDNISQCKDTEILNATNTNNQTSMKNKVFIVHGHSHEFKNEVARFIEGLNLTAIILHEQANSGTTLIEKVEKYSDVNYAIILYTSDDKLYYKDEKKEYK
jgi:hypothetical protein